MEKLSRMMTFPAKGYHPDHLRATLPPGDYKAVGGRASPASTMTPAAMVASNGVNSNDGTDGTRVSNLVATGTASGTPVHASLYPLPVLHPNTTPTLGMEESAAPTRVPAGVSTGPSRHNVHLV